MDKSLLALCDAVKKILSELKAQQPLAFLLLTGKVGQGKTTLLTQSPLQHITVEAEIPVDIFYDSRGLIVEIGEDWLNQSTSLLQHTIKQLNRCHRNLQISGLLYCIAVEELFSASELSPTDRYHKQAQLLNRFGQALGYPVDVALIFTQLDKLAGFTEFFHNDHESELMKPLGFSLPGMMANKIGATFQTQFNHLIESLNQQVIKKIHPARSGLKRSLIRELPIQFSSLRIPIQTLIQLIAKESLYIQSIYFTSAEQGGVSQDQLHQKIQHEYALTVPDKYPQAINHRAYFVEGAITSFIGQTKKHHHPEVIPWQKWGIGSLSLVAAMSVIWITHHHIQTAQGLDEASRELLLYESMVEQPNKAPALFHLTEATSKLAKIPLNLSPPTLQVLKDRLQKSSNDHMQGNFVPQILSELADQLTNSSLSPLARYQALRIYLMLGNAAAISESDVLAWYTAHWQKEPSESEQAKLNLLKQILVSPYQPIAINQQLVSDTRNYLNALPASYLYYSLAKQHFPQANTQQTIEIPGFELPQINLPQQFTKVGYQGIINQLPHIIAQLKADNWVLSRQDLENLEAVILQAYSYDYVSWWQNFMRRAKPIHFQDYKQAHQLAQVLEQNKSISKVVALLQDNTSPEFGEHSALFNQHIASQFTSLSLVSQSAIEALSANVAELDKFLTTLSIVSDQGQTAFTLAKARFQGDTLANPLSALYLKSQQLPDPISDWTKQIADNAWFTLIKEARNYINAQWHETVLPVYREQIANRFPFEPEQNDEVPLVAFEQFFGAKGTLNHFIDFYLKPFLDTSSAQWKPKACDSYVLPLSEDTLNEIIRANVISNMFFPNGGNQSHIQFSLQKLSLDPMVASLQLVLGNRYLRDDQNSDSFSRFTWPETNAKLTVNSIDGHHFTLDEQGPWAFFKLLQKVNVLPDEADAANLQIIFEINGNSGRYVLKTQNPINPFTPGILNGFQLPEQIA